MDNAQAMAARLLFSLARKRKWGESHTAYESMFKSFKSESLGKDGMNLARNTAEGLMRAGLILKKPTHYGLQVSLNPRMAHEIKRIIRENLGFDV
jgi:hypothetical protein